MKEKIDYICMALLLMIMLGSTLYSLDYSTQIKEYKHKEIYKCKVIDKLLIDSECDCDKEYTFIIEVNNKIIEKIITKTMYDSYKIGDNITLKLSLKNFERNIKLDQIILMTNLFFFISFVLSLNICIKQIFIIKDDEPNNMDTLLPLMYIYLCFILTNFFIYFFI